MGEIAEMMLEGTLCIDCGVALECDGFGIPIRCHDCHWDNYHVPCDVDADGVFCEDFYGRSPHLQDMLDEAATDNYDPDERRRL